VPVRGVVVWEALDGTRSRFGEDVPVYTAGMRFTDVITPRVAQLLEFIDRTKLIPDKRLGGVRFALEATGKALLDTPQPYRVKVISLRGMMVESDRPLEVESRCPMEVSQGGGAPLHFTGRVAFCGPATDGGRDVYHLGIEFLEMAPADRERLDALVKSLGSR
jgi:hypothetical protein